MDFLRNCSSGIQTLTGWTTFSYHCYSIGYKDDRKSELSAFNDEVIALDLVNFMLELEYNLRHERYLVYVDLKKRVLWTFESTTGQGSFATGALDITGFKIDPLFDIKAQSNGLFKSSDLASHAFSRRIMPAQSNVIALNQSPGVSESESLPEIYHNFVSAFHAMISYRMVRQENIIPLFANVFTVAAPEEDDSNPFEILSAPLRMLQSSIYLTSTGVLIFSLSPVNSSNGFGLSLLEKEHPIPIGATLALAPGLILAAYRGPAKDNFDSDINTQWRQIISIWLLRNGVTLDHQDNHQYWLSVRLLNHQHDNGQSSKEGPAFLWPSSLCFACPERTSIPSGSEPGISNEIGNETTIWFADQDNSGFINMLTFAEQWFQSQPEREQRLAAHKQQERDVVAARVILAPASPVNSRAITYGDSHGLAGVYPTPPDGLSSQPGAGGLSMDTPIAVSHDISSQGADVKIFPMDGDSEKIIQIMARPTMQLNRASKLDDDIFGPMDVDDFAGNDITDADFSFFDQPDEPVLPSDGPDAKRNVDENDGSDAKYNIDMEYDMERTVEDEKSSEIAEKPGVNLAEAGNLMDIEMVETEPEGKLPSSEMRRGKSLGFLTPDEVQRRLFSMKVTDVTNLDSTDITKRQSEYGPLLFNNHLSNNDAKYSSSGTFGIDKPTLLKNGPSNTDVKLKISLPKSTLQPNSNLHDRTHEEENSMEDSDDSFEDELSSIGNEERHSNNRGKSIRSDHFGMKNSPRMADMSQHSDELNSDDMTKICNCLILNECNKFPSDMRLYINLTSQLQRALKRETLSSLYPKTTSISRSDPNFIIIAQLVVDQLVMSSIGMIQMVMRDKINPERILDEQDRHRFNNSALDSDPQYEFDNSSNNALLVGLQQSAKLLVGFNDASSFMKYSSIQDTAIEQNSSQKNQPRPNQPKPPLPGSKGDVGLSGIPMRLATPLIRVRRNDTLWDMVSPSIAFWDTLGLAPCGGPKKIVSYTICPSNCDLELAVDQFINELGICYESSRLGTHTRGDSKSSELVQNGIIAWKLTSTNRSNGNAMEESLRKICVNLGNLLMTKVTAGTDIKTSQSESPYSFVIYIVNPFEDNTASLAMIASNFWQLFSTYKVATRSHQTVRIPDIQLQIIPISFLAKIGQLVLKQPSELQSFAREVYNRCPPTSLSEDVAALPINTGWAIQLAEALPRKISFELKADLPSNIMYENSQLHVGYARSSSGNWITAAFTDNSGRYQCHASYYMSVRRKFVDVAKEIWQTCLEIMQVRGVNWRLCIAKVGSMEMEELEAWANLASQQQPFSLITVLFAVDLSPSISIIPPLAMPNSPSPSAANRQAAYTPVSTPKPGVSPDPSAMTPAATPSELAASEAAHDPDAHVVDVTDDTWAVILSHRFNLQTGPLEYRQSLSSGLLIKVPPGTPTQNPFNPLEVIDPSKVHCIGVHLLWGRNQGKSPDTQDRAWNHPSLVAKGLADGLLREFLILFRNLALLAKVRDMRDWKAGLVPWHVLVASKAVDGLDAVYGMEQM